MNGFILLSKAIVIAFYVLVAVTFVTPFLTDYRFMLLAILGVILMIHSVEYLMLRKRMQAAAPGENRHFVQTLIFGYGHWLPLIKNKKQ